MITDEEADRAMKTAEQDILALQYLKHAERNIESALGHLSNATAIAVTIGSDAEF